MIPLLSRRLEPPYERLVYVVKVIRVFLANVIGTIPCDEGDSTSLADRFARRGQSAPPPAYLAGDVPGEVKKTPGARSTHGARRRCGWNLPLGSFVPTVWRSAACLAHHPASLGPDTRRSCCAPEPKTPFQPAIYCPPGHREIGPMAQVLAPNILVSRATVNGSTRENAPTSKVAQLLEAVLKCQTIPGGRPAG